MRSSPRRVTWRRLSESREGGFGATHGLEKVGVGLREETAIRGGIVDLLSASAVEKNDRRHRCSAELKRVRRFRHLLDDEVADRLEN